MKKGHSTSCGSRTRSPHCLVYLLVISCLFISSLAQAAAPTLQQRGITPQHWAYKALNSLAERGLLAGYPAQPLVTPPSLTRFETASLVLRAVAGIGQEYQRNGQALTALATPEPTPSALPIQERNLLSEVEGQIQAAERGSGIRPEDVAMLEKLAAEFRNELAGMGTKVNDLEKLLADTRQRLQVVESNLKRHQISGYVQFRFSDDQAKAHNTFFIRRARLTTAGQISPKTSYKIQLQLEGDNGKRVAIRDAYIDLVTGKYSRLRSGQAVLPISYELTEPDPDRIELERSFLMDRLFPDQRDIGIQWRFQKQTTAPAYELALVNGNGINTTDTNDRKDFIASVHAPFTWGSLSLAVYDGRLGTEPEQQEKDRLAAGLDVLRKGTELRGEYVAGRDRGADVEGWYARLSQFVTKTGTAYVKYDTYDENVDRPNDLFRRWTVGWSEQLDSNTRLALQWETRKIGRSFSDIASFRGDATMLQLQAKF